MALGITTITLVKTKAVFLYVLPSTEKGSVERIQNLGIENSGQICYNAKRYLPKDDILSDPHTVQFDPKAISGSTLKHSSPISLTLK